MSLSSGTASLILKKHWNVCIKMLKSKLRWQQNGGSQLFKIRMREICSWVWKPGAQMQSQVVWERVKICESHTKCMRVESLENVHSQNGSEILQFMIAEYLGSWVICHSQKSYFNWHCVCYRVVVTSLCLFFHAISTYYLDSLCLDQSLLKINLTTIYCLWR